MPLFLPSSVCQGCAELCIHRAQALGQYACICDHRHEIAVALPSGHDMCVQVRIEAGSRDAAQIQSYVETIRACCAAENLHAKSDELKVFRACISTQAIEVGGMMIWRDEKVSRTVGIPVHYDEVPDATVNDKPIFIVVAVASSA